MATARPKAQDFTGRQRLALQKEHADELAKRANEMSIAAEIESEKRENEVVDYSAPTPAPTVIDAVESVGVSLTDEFEVITTIEDLEDVTFGVGNHYSFEAGRKYKVPSLLASHLREKGYVW